MFLRFFLPRSILEPSSTFRIGSRRLRARRRYQVAAAVSHLGDKTSDRLFVIYARCTHLGCTPDWKASENKFKCPCHGSGYDSEGINFEGPRRGRWIARKVSSMLKVKLWWTSASSTNGRRARRTSLTIPALTFIRVVSHGFLT
jgi:nitrite reductase/ring-hydroxylating ferredoxin subunit